jgi:hypothetical protein
LSVCRQSPQQQQHQESGPNFFHHHPPALYHQPDKLSKPKVWARG